IDVDVGPDSREKAGRPDRPPHVPVPFPIPDLRHEAVVRAEAVSEILVGREPVDVRAAVVPIQLDAVTRERLAGPLLREIGAYWRSRAAVQELTGNRVAARRAPLKVGTGDAVVPVAVVRLAIGDERAHERQAEFPLRAADEHRG